MWRIWASSVGVMWALLSETKHIASAAVLTALCQQCAKRKGDRGAPFPSIRLSRSDAVVHLVLDRRRLVLPVVDLFPLELHVGVDLVVGEHAALGQEGAVAVKRVQRLAQRTRHGRHLGQLLRRQVVEVLV